MLCSVAGGVGRREMSSIYLTEPATHGKVLLHTSFGDIDIELWAKECPKACRNFVQLAMEGVSDYQLVTTGTTAELLCLRCFPER